MEWNVLGVAVAHSVVYVVWYTTKNEYIPIDNIDANNHDCRQLILYLIIQLLHVIVLV